jgi:hypothetical protein
VATAGSCVGNVTAVSHCEFQQRCIHLACDEGNAFDSDIDSVLEDNSPCDAEVECRGVIAIVDGSFSCTGHNDKGQIAVGSFWNPTNAAGAAQETEVPGVCTAQWKATPDN